MKLDNIDAKLLDTNAMLREICKHFGIAHGYEDIQKAREAHNSTQAIHRSGYTSAGSNGEAPIKASDVDFVYPKSDGDDVDISEIPF